MRAETLKGHLEAMLLAALEPGPRHGYAIIDAIKDASEGRIELPSGTIYPALHRLERAGLIASSWSLSAGRRRRTYELTPAGRRALSAERAAWREFSNTLTALLEPPPWPSTA